MAKFKIGDQVTWVGGRPEKMTYGKTYEVVSFDEPFVRVVSDEGKTEGWVSSCFELAPTSQGPVRTKTVKEIEPGRYGCITVASGVNGNRVQLVMASISAELMTWYDASELRAAALVLTQLAEALEE